jgi:hypothetical protein
MMPKRCLLVAALWSVALTAAEPRIARYGCRSYGVAGKPPLFVGYLTLSSGQNYQWATGTGRYAFDAAAGKVSFPSGPLAEQGAAGNFEEEREGKTHKIALVPKDGSKKFRMVCTHSTDAQ